MSAEEEQHAQLIAALQRAILYTTQHSRTDNNCSVEISCTTETIEEYTDENCAAIIC
jgi:hypothetical protein